MRMALLDCPTAIEGVVAPLYTNLIVGAVFWASFHWSRNSKKRKNRNTSLLKINEFKQGILRATKYSGHRVLLMVIFSVEFLSCSPLKGNRSASSVARLVV